MNRYDRFRPGKVWLDTAGKPIQAHGFSVFYNEKDGKYYWYGENKEKTKGGMFNKVWHWGVRCYTSEDLYNWENKGQIIPPQPDDLQSPLQMRCWRIWQRGRAASHSRLMWRIMKDFLPKG